MSPWAWTDLFPQADYRFNFQFKRGLLDDFYRPSQLDSSGLIDRSRLLSENRSECLTYLPDAAESIAEAHQLFVDLKLVPSPLVADPEQSLLTLGRALEADIILLRIKEDQPTIIGGVVCFPTGWRLPDKLGRHLLDIHDVVPQLNAELGTRMHRFLEGLKPGVSWERANWGLSASAQLNLNPILGYPRLTQDTRIEEIYMRVESQSLTVLPIGEAILFGIRIHLTPLTRLWSDPDLRQRIQRSLQTMPPRVADYKGLNPILAMLTSG